MHVCNEVIDITLVFYLFNHFVTWRQCYKPLYFRFTYIFSVFFVFLWRSKDPFSVLRKYGKNVCIMEVRSFITLTIGHSLSFFPVCRMSGYQNSLKRKYQIIER